jgi:tRNA-Thr(GGU) m(6)t(6)A37 methyltransferase TsaA
MNKIKIKPIGLVKRQSIDEDNKDRSLISKIIINKKLTKALDGIDDFSHIYIIFWMDKIKDTSYLHHPGKGRNLKPVGIFATRAPIHTNPMGLTLVELIKREENVLWVKGLDAYDNTPVLDIKPYPDWEHGVCFIVDDYRVPKWLNKAKPITQKLEFP